MLGSIETLIIYKISWLLLYFSFYIEFSVMRIIFLAIYLVRNFLILNFFYQHFMKYYSRKLQLSNETIYLIFFLCWQINLLFLVILLHSYPLFTPHTLLISWSQHWMWAGFFHLMFLFQGSGFCLFSRWIIWGVISHIC